MRLERAARMMAERSIGVFSGVRSESSLSVSSTFFRTAGVVVHAPVTFQATISGSTCGGSAFHRMPPTPRLAVRISRMISWSHPASPGGS